MKAFAQVYLITATLAITFSVTKCQPNEEDKGYEFGFTIDGQQHRHEKKDSRGIIEGEFGFITADGIYHVTVYATDENGDFKILSMRNIRISAPLDGSPLIGEISPEAEKYLKKLPPGQRPPPPSTAPPPPPPPPVSAVPLSLVPEQPIPQVTTPRAPAVFTTQPTLKPACASCGYVTTQKTDTFQFQNPKFQSRGSGGQDNNQQNNLLGGVNSNQNQPTNAGQPSYNQNQGPSAGPLGNNQYQQNSGSPVTSNQYQPNNNAGAVGYNQNQQQNAQGFGQSAGQQQPGINEVNQYAGGPQPTPGQDLLAPGVNPANSPNPLALNGGVNGESNGNAAPEPPRSTLPPIDVKDNTIHVGGASPQDIPIRDKYPGMQDGLPAGVEEKDVKDLLYKFHYEVGFHGHYEKGYKNGAKVGGYFVNGRDGISRVVTYVADENGYRPKFKFINLGLDADGTPKEATEKTFGLKSFEFVWYPIE